jgi:hypothetical protein
MSLRCGSTCVALRYVTSVQPLSNTVLASPTDNCTTDPNKQHCKLQSRRLLHMQRLLKYRIAKRTRRCLTFETSRNNLRLGIAVIPFQPFLALKQLLGTRKMPKHISVHNSVSTGSPRATPLLERLMILPRILFRRVGQP